MSRPSPEGETRGDGLRILLVLPFAPRSDADHGGGRVVADLVRQLAERHRVAIVHAARSGEPEADGAVCRDVDEVVGVPIDTPAGSSVRRRAIRAGRLVGGTPLWAQNLSSAALARALVALGRSWRPDLVRVEFGAMARYLQEAAPLGVPRLLVDYDPVGTAAMGAVPSARRALDRRAWRRFERRTTRHAEAVVVLTDSDRRAIEPLVAPRPITVIPLAVECSGAPADPVGRPGEVLFVGNFAHPPNAEAALRLAGSIMPRVTTARPGAILTIVGDDPPPELLGLASGRADLRVVGRVPRVGPFLEGAAVVVAPMATGRGMRVKVIEALAAGKAVVASSLAVEGVPAVHGRDLLIADGDGDVAEAIVGLLADPVRREELARAGRAMVERELGWDRWHRAFDGLYRDLLVTAADAAPAEAVAR